MREPFADGFRRGRAAGIVLSLDKPTFFVHIAAEGEANARLLVTQSTDDVEEFIRDPRVQPTAYVRIFRKDERLREMYRTGPLLAYPVVEFRIWEGCASQYRGISKAGNPLPKRFDFRPGKGASA